MIYPHNFEQKTGFDKIRLLLKKKCFTQAGIGLVETMNFSNNADEIFYNLNITKEYKHLLESGSDIPELYFADFLPVLHRIRPEGTFLITEELSILKNSLTSIYRFTDFIKKHPSNLYPLLQNEAEKIANYKIIIEKIDNILDRFGKIRDNASPELSKLRQNIKEKQVLVVKVMQSILRQIKADGGTEDDSELVIREGRMVIPVYSSYKRQVHAILRDESATGKTAFIEPIEAVHINNDILALEFEEKREIVKILTVFTSFLRPYLPELHTAYNFLVSLEFIQAKARLAIEMKAVVPNMDTNPILSFDNIRHPLLEIHLRNEHK
ncbi:MAG: endonuclease MutS2, partial [Bacteroidales bacterium]